MPTTPATNRFRKLITDISRLYINARKIQIQFAWETGRRMVEEEQNGEMRAAYGSSLLARVSEVLAKKYGAGFSESNLRKMRHFYLLNPKQSVATELDWTDYVELLPIEDARTRQRLEQRILKENLNSKEVRQIVRKVRQLPEAKSTAKLPPLKRPTDLKLNTFRKSKLGSKLKDGDVLIDCGFVVNWPVSRDKLKKVILTDTPSYTYEAVIDRVIDGDTLLVVIEVGFRIKVYDKLRLRGIDCPELGTPEGERAKRFVAGLLPVDSVIVLKSHKTRTDTYGRFVADVFFKTGENNCDEIISHGIYLNQYLLDQGHAVRMKE